MKKALFSTLLTITLLSVSSVAFAAFVQTVTPDAANSGYQFVEVNWAHTYDGSVPDPSRATLTIWADDVDDASPGWPASGYPAEQDKVFLNGVYLGDLLTYGEFDNNRPDGIAQNLSMTVFDITHLLAPTMAFQIEVFNGTASHAMELISSTLTVAPTPIPGAVWLLGSGLVGLMGLRRRQRG